MNAEDALCVALATWPRSEAGVQWVIDSLRRQGWVLVDCDCGEEGRHPRFHWYTCPTYERWSTADPMHAHNWLRWDSFGDYGWTCYGCGASVSQDPT